MSAPAPAAMTVAPANPPWLVRLGKFCFKTRNALFPVVLITLFIVTAPVVPPGGVRVARLLDLVGLLVAVAGQTLRVAVIGYRYIVRGGRDHQVYANDLVTSGIFGLSRNPLYVGNLLIMGGLFIIWNSPWLYLIGGPFFLLGYRAIVAAEEDYLGREFGDAYIAYARQTPRWWPRLAAFGAATTGIPFNWRRVVLKEYSSTALWMAAAAMLLMLKARYYAGLAETTAPAWPYWTAVAVLALLWSGARYLKKSRRLRE